MKLFTLLLAACLGMTAVNVHAQDTNAIRAARIAEMRVAISNLFQLRLAAMTNAAVQTKNGRVTVNQRKFLANIESIDTHGAPQKIRVLWLAYVQACEDNIRHGKKIAGEVLAGAVAATVPVGGVAVAAKEAGNVILDASQDDPAVKAWHALKLRALEDGVDCPVDPKWSPQALH
jgi:hypothetical protein